MSRRITLKIYIGNLPWSIADNELDALFAVHGHIVSAQVVSDKEHKRSGGFGFVVMDTESGNRAILALDGYELESNTLRVHEAETTEKRVINL